MCYFIFLLQMEVCVVKPVLQAGNMMRLLSLPPAGHIKNSIF